MKTQIQKTTPVSGPYAVTCPTIGCGAKPNMRCTDEDYALGVVLRPTPHAARIVESLPDTPKLRNVKRIANNPHSLPRGY